MERRDFPPTTGSFSDLANPSQHWHYNPRGHQGPYPRHQRARLSPSGRDQAVPTFSLNQGSPEPTPTPSVTPLSFLTSPRTPSDTEWQCMRAVEDEETFLALPGQLDSSMLGLSLVRTRAGTVDAAGQWCRGNISVGDVVALPVSPSFEWSRWQEATFHLFKVTQTIVRPPPATEAFRLLSGGLLGAPTPSLLNFPVDCVNLTLPSAPPFLITITDPDLVQRCHRNITERASAPPTLKRKLTDVPGEPLPAMYEGGRGEHGEGSLFDSFSDEGNNNSPTGGLKRTRDGDGHDRVYRPAAAMTMLSEMQLFWRSMCALKLLALVPAGQAPDFTFVQEYMLQYLNVQPPSDLPPHLASFYGFTGIRGAKAVTCTEVYKRAFFLSWPRNDWVTMNVLYFLVNPKHAELAVFAGNTNPDVRKVVELAIDGWLDWMVVHFGHHYNDQLPLMRGWLLDPPPGRRDMHDGLHLLFLVNNLLSSWCNTITSGSSVTRFSGVTFGARVEPPLAALRLLDAMDREFVERTVKDDPFPHHGFTAWRKDNTIKGYPSGDSGGRTPASSSTQKTTPAPGTSPAPAPSRPEAGVAIETVAICPWHAGFVWECADSKGAIRDCTRGPSCPMPHVDPESVSASDIRTACELKMYPGSFRDRLLEAITKKATRP